MKISQLRKIIKETIGEMAMDEMARTPGTGAAFILTDEGDRLVRQMGATGEIPDEYKDVLLSALGKPSRIRIEILKFLFKAKGKRVQKIDFAKMLNVAQPQVNSQFKPLEDKGLITSAPYTSALGGTTSSTPKAKLDVQAMLGDLDFGDE
jgi:hypothetical protein